jgi:hypothetical protein
MAREPMTLEEIRATRLEVDPVKIAATTEEDIRRHQIEDGEDPAPRSHGSVRHRTSEQSARSFR